MLISDLIIFGLMVLVASMIATRIAIPLLAGLGFTDHANARSDHTGAVTTSGGIALVLGMAVACVLFTIFELSLGRAPALWNREFGILMTSAVVLSAVSAFDDKFPMKVWSRLAVQFSAAVAGCFVLYWMSGVWAGNNPNLPYYFVAAFVLTVFTVNAFNFMDGIDGLSGSALFVFGLSGAVLSYLSGYSLAAFLQVAVAMTGLGFLAFNLPPARVFMGDAGSVPLSFVLFVTSLILLVTPYWAAAIVVPSLYVVDVGTTLLKRVGQGKNILQSHREHAYQMMRRAGLSVRDILLLFLAFSALNSALIWATIHQPMATLLGGYALALAAILTARIWSGRRLAFEQPKGSSQSDLK